MKLKIESDVIYKDLRCVVIFTPGGYRCGYVGLTSESQYYGKFYDDLKIECHGGLTYSDGGKEMCIRDRTVVIQYFSGKTANHYHLYGHCSDRGLGADH